MTFQKMKLRTWNYDVFYDIFYHYHCFILIMIKYCIYLFLMYRIQHKLNVCYDCSIRKFCVRLGVTKTDYLVLTHQRFCNFSEFLSIMSKIIFVYYFVILSVL